MSGKKATVTPIGKPLDSRYADEKGRLFFYDNAKFILIFLVILGHAISPFQTIGDGQSLFKFIWRIVNVLHMPCMIFISGFFAKKYIRPDGSINVQRPFTYMLYYFTAQLIIGAFEVFVIKDSICKSLLEPRASMWFLACLSWWYMLLPVIDKINPKVMFPIAVVVGLCIGYDIKMSNFMAISRMITHFPFFLLGYYITGDQIKGLFTKKAKLWALLIGALSIGSIVAVMFLFSESGPLNFSINGFITCDRSYHKIFNNKGVNPLLWFLPRLWFYLCAAGLCFSFLAFVPRRKMFFTKFGARTLAPYILHTLIYIAYKNEVGFNWSSFDWFKYEWFGWKNLFVLRLLIIPVVFIITVVLSLYPFYWPFEMLGKIKIKRLLKDSKTKN